MKSLKSLLLFITLSALTACVVVVDPEPYWKDGQLDPVLKGYWQIENEANQYGHIITENGSYRFVGPKDEHGDNIFGMPFRTIKAGDASFIIVNTVEGMVPPYIRDPHYYMARYEVKEGKVILYGFNEKKFDEFIRQHGDKNITGINNSTANSVQISKLTPEVIALGSKLSSSPDYWQVVATYVRRQP